MKIKKTNRRHAERNKILLFVIILASISGIFGLSLGIGQELNEAEQLENELSNGYEWLTNYTLNENESASIEVYEKDKNNIIAKFVNIISNAYNKVFLTGLNGSQDTFDLKIVEGEEK